MCMQRSFKYCAYFEVKSISMRLRARGYVMQDFCWRGSRLKGFYCLCPRNPRHKQIIIANTHRHKYDISLFMTSYVTSVNRMFSMIL